MSQPEQPGSSTSTTDADATYVTLDAVDQAPSSPSRPVAHQTVVKMPAMLSRGSPASPGRAPAAVSPKPTPASAAVSSPPARSSPLPASPKPISNPIATEPAKPKEPEPAQLESQPANLSAPTTPTLSRAVNLEAFTSKRKTEAFINQTRSEGTKSFYSRQNGIIDLYEQVSHHSNLADASPMGQALEDDDERLSVKIAIRASFAVNIFLVVMKIFIAISSHSISVMASALDSILDIISGSVIFVINWLTRQQDVYSYPVGKSRLEPLGLIIFSTLMFTTAMQIIIEAIKRLIDHSIKIQIDKITLGGLVLTIVLKLLLYLYCRTVTGSSSVEALAQDHRNDVISNSVTIATTLIAYYKPEGWWVDPVGGIAIGLYIMVVWVRTGFQTVRMMTGYVAPPDLIKKWTYLAMEHHPSIIAIDTVRGYHTSEGFIVELDIVLPEEMPLKEAHDIGEALQFKVEALEEVERCFVHLDYETDHKPEH